MTREEFLEKYKYSKNCYRKYSVTEMKKDFPELLFLYSAEAMKKYNCVSYSYAKKNKLEIENSVCGFICNHYGCFPLFKVKSKS